MAPGPRAWQLIAPHRPLELRELEPLSPGHGEVVVKVLGCGVCQNDVRLVFDTIVPAKALPVTPGHEIVGQVVETGHEAILHSGRPVETGQDVIIPYVLPCGTCRLCRLGHENICLNQKMPGEHLDGGFASHVRVPARYLVPVPGLPPGHELAHLAVIAHSVTAPYQALLRARVTPGDPVVIIGAGGIGIFAVQLAAARGARVLAVDKIKSRTRRAEQYGAVAGVCTAGLPDEVARDAILEAAAADGLAPDGWKIFEMSGTPTGQALAFALLGPAGALGLVGRSTEKLPIALGRLVDLDADVFGSWGCRPQHYSAVLDLLHVGRVQIRPFVSFHPLDQVNNILMRARDEELETRAVLLPDA
jgi:6-hydroxycyclohex-1-ene-1-carbonyl-CoA dehydrogenase